MRSSFQQPACRDEQQNRCDRSYGRRKEFFDTGALQTGRVSIDSVSVRIHAAHIAYVRLDSGTIEIDGVDIASIGLRTLRSRLSLIPQEPLLFSGTIRSNLDPFDKYTDAHLLDAMRKAALLDSSDEEKTRMAEGGSTRTRFNLDTPVESEGQNLSVGERALLSLARALVKDSQIIILDEATASTDAATDAKIQETIRREFKNKTILCIAHRLRTILSFDKILVMDAGTCREYAEPIELFQREDSVFRSLCLTSDITLEDIQNAQKQAQQDRTGR
jgi:ATP-binding cassette subfamily C (CFTR/MRP) protein 1